MTFVNEAAVTAFFAKLAALNGLENYVPSEVPDEVLTGNKMMAVTSHALELCNVNNSDLIGMGKHLGLGDLFQVAAVNYQRLKASNHPHAIIVAYLRALIIGKGLQFNAPAHDSGYRLDEKVKASYTRRAEIIVVKESAEAVFKGTTGKEEEGVVDLPGDISVKVDGIKVDLKPMIDFFGTPESEDLTVLATLLPIFSALEFQKTNHHYVDNDFYKDSYLKHFKSAQIGHLAQAYNKVDLIYDAIHWMGPYNMEHWKQNLCQTTHVPRGVKLKQFAAPAGTAVVMTQLAVWAAISVFPGAQALVKEYDPLLKKMDALGTEVRKPTSRLAYHIFCPLFGVASALESELALSGLKAASSLAPIAQAFIETIAKGSDLARAKALKKHSDQNIGLFKIAEAAFKGAHARIVKEARVKTLSEAILPTAMRALPAPQQVVELEPET